MPFSYSFLTLQKILSELYIFPAITKIGFKINTPFRPVSNATTGGRLRINNFSKKAFKNLKKYYNERPCLSHTVS